MRAIETKKPQGRPSGVLSAGNCGSALWSFGFDGLAGLLHPMTPWFYIALVHVPFSSWPGISNCSAALPPGRLSVSAKAAAPYEIWHWRRREFYSPESKPCVNAGVPGRNILGLSFIWTVNDVSREWWVVIVSCIQILISQKYGHNQ